MNLGIVAAMAIEADMIKEAMTEKTSETISGVEFVSGKLGQRDVVVAVCGIGKVFAALCTQTMILRYHPEQIINTGVGGTLIEYLSIGDLAISTAVVQHDMDTSPLGDPVGMLSGLNQIKLPADKNMVEKVCQICEKKGIRHHCGVIASGDQFIASREKKDWIVSTFQGISCEMEGASVGHVCTVNKVPFVILRAISDSADGGACEDYPSFAKKAAKTSAGVVMELCGVATDPANNAQ